MIFELHTLIRIGAALEAGRPAKEVFVEAFVTTPAAYEPGKPLAGHAYPVSMALATAILEGTAELAELYKEFKVV